MKLLVSNETIPGTKLKRDEMGGLTGLAFLKQVFFVSDGVMLSQIRKIAGIDGSTLQNWTKRGWVANAHSKKYNIDQIAHILLINMLRSCMQLDKIAWLLEYINGDINDMSDDIIQESKLYDLICCTLDSLENRTICNSDAIREVIAEVLSDYKETVNGAKNRLSNALEIIIFSYYASIIKHDADYKINQLMGDSNVSDED